MQIHYSIIIKKNQRLIGIYKIVFSLLFLFLFYNLILSMKRIPILVFDKSYYYENSDDLKMPIAMYVRNFKKLYPLVIVSS